MRIRRRAPPPPPPPPPSFSPDPPINGEQDEHTTTRRQAAAVQLHPDGDLPPLLQEKMEEMEMDSSRMWSAGVGSNKSGGSGLGAEILGSIGKSGALEINGVGEHDNGVGEEEESDKKPPLRRERKGKAKAKGNAASSDQDVDEKAGGRKRRSPAVLMEGSRCSRVNGRGWRCCQQTLVGYSLCEHHLGKGRLRSVSSVRGQLGTSKPLDGAMKEMLLSLPTLKQNSFDADADADGDDDDDDDDDEKEVKRRRKKIGTVKARSINSLLDKTDNSTDVVLQPTTPAAAAAAVEPQDRNV